MFLKKKKNRTVTFIQIIEARVVINVEREKEKNCFTARQSGRPQYGNLKHSLQCDTGQQYHLNVFVILKIDST